VHYTLQQFNTKQTLNTVKTVLQDAAVNNTLWTRECLYEVLVYTQLCEEFFHFVFL